MPHRYSHAHDLPGCFASAICNANKVICAKCVHLGQCRWSMLARKSAVYGVPELVIPLGGIKTGPAGFERIAKANKTASVRRGQVVSRPRQASLFDLRHFGSRKGNKKGNK